MTRATSILVSLATCLSAVLVASSWSVPVPAPEIDSDLSHSDHLPIVVAPPVSSRRGHDNPTRIVVPVAPEMPSSEPRTRPAKPATSSIAGRLADRSFPGFGESWIIEAYRLTSLRNTIIERRRVFVDTDGNFRFATLGPGLWQIVLVAPLFSWGPLLDVGDGLAASTDAVRLPAGGHERLRIDLGADDPRLLAREVRLELFAVRSPELSESGLRVQTPVAVRSSKMSEGWTFDGLVAGTYEVVVTLVDAGSRGNVVRSDVVVGRGRSSIELRFDR